MELRPRLGSKMALVTVLVLSVSILIGITGARVDAQPGRPRLCKGPNQAKCDPAPSTSPNPPTSPSPEPSPVTSPSPEPSPAGSASDLPPPADGYFGLVPAGNWSSLPSGTACGAMVNRSTWEPRPRNANQNATMPDPDAVHAAFAARPRSVYNTYDPRWDSWLLQRVDGQFTGTTDEIFQWAACKWGLPDNMLRGIAVRESTWSQYYTNVDGTCVVNRGCGDVFPTTTSDSRIYCDGLTRVSGHDYQPQFGAGNCPKTFSIAGVMSWDNPAWQAPAPSWPDNQNGTFPFNRNSTAFAVDYLGAYLRGCYEGWESWLHPVSGDIWGCVGSWYSGDWRSAAADGYISRVQNEIANHTWLDPSFAEIQP